MSQGPERQGRPDRDPNREPNSPAGAASPQGEQAGDKEQAEGEPDEPDGGSTSAP
jgi:hypothetical protein